MVAELVPSPPPLVGCLDALEQILDSMPVGGYAELDPGLQRHAVERLRRIKARVTGQELAAVRALDAGLGDKARTGEILARGFGRDQHEADRTVRVAKTSCAPSTTTKPTTNTGNSDIPPTATSRSRNPTASGNASPLLAELVGGPPTACGDPDGCNSLSPESL